MFYNKRFIFVFLISLFVIEISLFNRTSLAQSCYTGQTGCNFPSIVYQQCSPCNPGDEGKLRYGSWFIGGASCGGGSYARYTWNCCTCGGSGTPSNPPASCTKKCSTFCENWYNPTVCPTHSICNGDYLGTTTCGNIATDPYGNSVICGNQCDPGCPATTQCGMCGNPSCCTVSAPNAPVQTAPANNTSLTRSASTILRWNAPTSWGNDCNNAANYYALTTNFNGTATTIYPTTTSNTYSLGVCNSTVTWRVAAYNGAAWSPWSSYLTFTNTGFTGPSTTITSTSTAVSNPNAITFTVSATDPDSNLSWIRLRIDRINGYGTGTTSMTNVYNSSNVNCSGGTCSRDFNWSPTLAQSNYYYAAYALAADSCGYASALSTPHIFQVTPSYNLQVNVDRLGLVVPDGDGNIDFNSVCSNVTGDFSNVSVTYYAGGISRSTGVSNSSGVVTFNNIPQADVNAGITLTASANNVESCQSYDFYCYGNTAGTMGNQANHRVDFTGVAVGGTKSVNIGLGEEKKDSWETVFDGDIYARNANVGVSCTEATAGGGFETTTLVEDTIGGFFRTSGSLNSNATKDIYTGDNSGYAKDLDGLENNAGNQLNSLDAWFHNYTFPSMGSLSAPTVTTSTFSNIQGNRVYKSTGDLSISGSYNLSSADAVSLVYVDGDLTFTGNLTSNNGLVVFIVRGNVVISSSVGISNYTTAGTYTPTTGANIAAGILGLNDVTFASGGSGDNPIILNGFVMNRGDIYFNRDLLGNNDRYPAHVIKYNTRILAMLSNLEESVSTGLATYDVQWIYDEN